MAISLETLLEEAKCYCGASASTSERVVMALLQRIAEASGSGGGGTPGGAPNSVQFNDGGAFGGFGSYNSGTGLLTLTGNLTVPSVTGNLTGNVTGSSSLNVLKAGDTMTGLLTIAQATANTSNLALTGYSLTGANAQSMISGAGTWNTTGSPVGIRLAITDTASNAASKLIELLGGAAGATTLFSVNKAGQLILASGTTALPAIVFSADAGLNTGIYRQGAGRIGFATVGNLVGEFNANTFELKAGVQLNWNADLRFERDAANEFGQRNGATAQVHRIYRTFTSLANYERLALQSAAGQMIVAAETAGTGTDDLDLVLTAAGVGRVTLQGGANLLKTTAAMTSGPGAAVGTLTDAPSAGNADVWCPIMFNGVQYWFPCWSL